MATKSTVSPARVAARKGLETAIRGAFDATIAAANKTAALATAIKACLVAGISTDDTRNHARRATVAHVMGCELPAADKYLVKGATRPEKLEKALVAFRQTMSRAFAMAETGEKSVRKAKKRKARAAQPVATPAVQPLAPVPATLKAVTVPITTKPADARAFCLDSLALFRRAEKAMAKAIDQDTRAAISSCIAALAKLEAKETTLQQVVRKAGVAA